MLGDALVYPKNRDSWLKTVGIGGALLATSFLILPYFVLLGYTLDVIRSGADTEPKPPVFDEWVDCFIDGLTLFGIQVLYAIVGFGIPLAIVGFGWPSLLQTPRTPLTPDPTSIPSLSTAGIIVVLLCYLFAFLVLYVSLVATARFAHEDRFEAAFEIRSIIQTALISEFFVGFVLFLSLGFVLGVSIALPFLFLVGVSGPFSGMLFFIIFGAIPLFYTHVCAYYLIGWGYRRAADRQTRDSPSIVPHETSQ